MPSAWAAPTTLLPTRLCVPGVLHASEHAQACRDDMISRRACAGKHVFLTLKDPISLCTSVG